jgi:hypothetical protein
MVCSSNERNDNACITKNLKTYSAQAKHRPGISENVNIKIKEKDLIAVYKNVRGTQ